jgi:hypothetical protein
MLGNILLVAIHFFKIPPQFLTQWIKVALKCRLYQKEKPSQELSEENKKSLRDIITSAVYLRLSSRKYV